MYYLLFAPLYLISLLPFRLLYLLSDACCWLLYRVWGYRKAIVAAHIAQAFPEKPPQEQQEIIRRFYHSFCDQWIETLKLISLSPQRIKQRMNGNWEVFEQAAQAGNGRIVALLGHQFNWEWANLATPLYFSGRYAGIYLPIRSRPVNRLLLYIRRRTGALLIPANDLKSGFHALENQNHILAFIADQNPGSLKVADWHLFMNRPAPFLNGPEKVARMRQAAVVWVGLRKIGRGQYQMQATLCCTNARELPPGAITQKYVSFLEEELRQSPPNWMWTHRRWKRQPPEEWLHREA